MTKQEVNYYVYVIGLDKTVVEAKRFRERNPNYVEGKPCVYVGQSYHKPEERFAQHLEGYKSSRIPRKYGKYLNKRLYESINPISTREEAERKEEELAAKLLAKGYGVWWG